MIHHGPSPPPQAVDVAARLAEELEEGTPAPADALLERSYFHNAAGENRGSFVGVPVATRHTCHTEEHPNTGDGYTETNVLRSINRGNLNSLIRFVLVTGEVVS